MIGMMPSKRMTPLLGLAFLLVWCVGLGKAQGEEQQQNSACALRVSVLREDGTYVRTANVDLLDPSGKIIQSKKADGGRAEFCDFGFGYHSIVVRTTGHSCETTVKNIKVVPDVSQQIKVIFNICSYGGIHYPTNRSFVYFRVTSSDGEELQGVRIEGGDWSPQITDGYGRSLVEVPPGSTELTLSKDGFESQKVKIEAPDYYSEKEIAVQMRPSK